MIRAVDALALFSANEDKDDLATGDVKYLMIPFYQAEVLGHTHAGAGGVEIVAGFCAAGLCAGLRLYWMLDFWLLAHHAPPYLSACVCSQPQRATSSTRQHRAALPSLPAPLPAVWAAEPARCGSGRGGVAAGAGG